MNSLAETTITPATLTHLQRLEAESIHILREVVANAENPVMLYSVGKDSACMLHLARKAFYPAPPPFPLLHVDTTWKFRAMYELRDRAAKDAGMDLIVHQNPEAKAQGINPFDHGPLHTDMWKTEGLKQALTQYNFDVAFGGARRDEEKSRAKERIFSFRSANHRWDPKSQRPELWKLYNTRKAKGESIRVFPLSNWTELDIWQYIHLEGIEIVPLPTIREADGLAMSSRNRYLSPEDRALAPLLHGVMQALAARIRNRDDLFRAVQEAQTEIISAGFELDYLEARHAESLAPVTSLADGPIRILVAARLGATRLIDNIPV